MSGSRNDLEPVASRTTGTPPAGETSTAGSSSSRSLPCSVDRHGGDESLVGVGVKPALRARGQSPLCGVRGRAPRATAPPSPSSLDTYELTRPERETCA